MNYINKHLGKGVIWCMAYDNGPAGRKYNLKFKKMVEDMGEQVEILMCPSDQLDWDECLQHGEFKKPDFSEKCSHRGKLLAATDIKQYSWVKYTNKSFSYALMPSQNGMYTVQIKGLQAALEEEGSTVETDVGYRLFREHVDTKNISNVDVNLDFLYLERDDLMNERYYQFNVRYQNGSPSSLLSVTGSELESPSTFNKALLNNTDAGTFEGSRIDLKILRDRWFR